MKVLKIETNNKYYIKEINNDLKEMQKEVGGYIEYVRLKHNFNMVVDEEGHIKEKEFNLIATNICYMMGYPCIIVGDVFITGNEEKIKELSTMIDLWEH